jgi:uncharacterized protein (DUF4213/DUF364 family)
MADQLIQHLLQTIHDDAPVERLLVGAHWTAVSSRFCGMASTVMSSQHHGEGRVREAGALHLQSAKTLAQYLLSDNYLEASIGLAAFNSLNEIPEEKITSINAFKVVAEKGIGRQVAVFGHFPYLKEVQASAKKLSVFELNPGPDELPLDRVPQVLPDAEVIAITSNAIINHTIEGILPYMRKDAYAILVGPSTPLNPMLFEYGFSLLAGVRVIDKEALFLSVSQGAIFRQVRGAELITISK